MVDRRDAAITAVSPGMGIPMLSINTPNPTIAYTIAGLSPVRKVSTVIVFRLVEYADKRELCE
ncbi:hypothetical protein CULCOIPH002_22170 [Corynebacterium ulcerans]|nr:hypothetical protein CULCOIPH001_20010 [Corynebacterium ulcerans]GJJ37305.1 hypothetical protein CULCOIPH002_22170 [Corynebacterium ulcerans]